MSVLFIVVVHVCVVYGDSSCLCCLWLFSISVVFIVVVNVSVVYSDSSCPCSLLW